MARAREPIGEGPARDASHPRPSGLPRDAALDEAITLATRDRRVRDGYSTMTIGDIVSDAKVTRPTLCRRWRSKFEPVVNALTTPRPLAGETHTPPPWTQPGASCTVMSHARSSTSSMRPRQRCDPCLARLSERGPHRDHTGARCSSVPSLFRQAVEDAGRQREPAKHATPPVLSRNGSSRSARTASRANRPR